jgi:hypothetical protein
MNTQKERALSMIVHKACSIIDYAKKDDYEGILMSAREIGGWLHDIIMIDKTKTLDSLSDNEFNNMCRTIGT